jgi:sigma-B regulation protein RsbU (phosphoserine phosphatase)
MSEQDQSIASLNYHPDILVVDDSTSYRRLLSHPLRQWGYTVLEAEDGQQALNMLCKQHIGMVISDWEMPELDGPELCRAVREANLDHYVYFMLVTARGSAEDLVLGMDAGADDFLTKPINPQELRVRLRAGERILKLEAGLAERNKKLDDAYQLIENDLKAAAKLQRSLLPSADRRIENMQCRWLFLPSQYVSGDMHNYFQIDANHMAFYSVDVSGHGVKPAMLSVTLNRLLSHGSSAGLLKQATNEAPFYRLVPPNEVIEQLNAQFQMSADDSTYFTIVYGIFNIHTGMGSLTRAGHPTPLIIHANGETDRLDNGGLPIGMVEDVQYENESFQLLAGSRICLYTDGITECERHDGEQYGEDRLHAFLLEQQPHSLDQVLHQLQGVLEEWRGLARACFDDDVSILMLSYEPNAERVI